MANVFEHGFVGVQNPQQKWLWTSYVGSVPPRAYLPPCNGPADTPCIESVSSRVLDQSDWQTGSVSQNQYKYNYGEKCAACAADYGPFVPIPFDKSNQYGGTPSMWSLPQAPHGGGSDYRVDVQLNQKTIESSGKNCVQGPCTFIQIVPLKLGPSLSPDTNWSGAAPSLDYTQFEFPQNVEYRIVLRLKGANLIAPDGFLFGRVNNLQVTSSSDDMNRMTIIGTPTRVPFAEISGKPMATIPYSLIASGDPLRQTWTCTADDVNKCVTPMQANELYNFTGWENFGLKTIGSGTIWEMRAANPPSAGTCSNLFTNNGITGTLTVNSTIYSSDIPTWDEATKSFTFSVGSTHFNEVGLLNKGFYQLALKEGIVKCLWGSAASAANAKIQIVSQDGMPEIATTSVQVQDGIFYFTASNFEYSNPKLRVTLVPKKSSPTVVLSPQPSSTLKVVKKSTIVCAKGKATKKVTTVKPTCPAGWKKKV